MPKKLLVVDDDLDQLRALSIRLKASGYEVLCASDGLQAASKVRHEAPDLILLDIGLPEGDGYEVMEELMLLSAPCSPPIIVLSAKDPVTHRERVMKAGAKAFFQKPAENAALLAAIRRLLGGADERYRSA